MPGARRTHCHACKIKRRTQANTGTPKSLRHSLRNGFTAAPCSSWCAGLVSHHRLRGVPGRRPTSPIRTLDSSIAEPEPHGLTVRIAPHVLRPNASIASRLTSGDEWPSRPPCRGGLSSLNHKYSISEREIFLRGALDSSGKTGGGFLVFCPSCRGGSTPSRAPGPVVWPRAPLFG